MIIAIASAKGAPGTSTTALALTLTWERRVLLAELDPAGTSLLPGYLAPSLEASPDLAGRGLLAATTAALAGRDMTTAIWEQLIDLDPPRQHRLVLAGITDPVQASAVEPAWASVAEALAKIGGGPSAEGDVIVDLGRATGRGFAWPVAQAADKILIAVRPTLFDLSPALPVVEALARFADRGRLGLVVIGEGDYRPAEIAADLRIKTLARLPWDVRAAKALAGFGSPRPTAPLLRAAAGAGRDLADVFRAGAA